MKHKPITARERRKDQVEVINYTHPPYDGVAGTLKKLKRCANAFAYVRGAVPDKKLAAQLAAYADAIEIIRFTLPRITDGKPIEGPCDLREVINKAARRDKKFRDALNLTGFER